MKAVKFLIIVLVLMAAVSTFADEAVDKPVLFTNSVLSVTNTTAQQYLIGVRVSGAFDGTNEVSFTLSQPSTTTSAILLKSLTTTNTLAWTDEGALSVLWKNKGVLTITTSAAASATNSAVITTLNKRDK